MSLSALALIGVLDAIEIVEAEAKNKGLIVIGHSGLVATLALRSVCDIEIPVYKGITEPSYTKFNTYKKRKKGRP